MSRAVVRKVLRELPYCDGAPWPYPADDLGVVDALLRAAAGDGLVERVEEPIFPGAPPLVTWRLTVAGAECLAGLQRDDK